MFLQRGAEKIETAVLRGKKKKLIGILLCLALTWEDIDFTAGVLSVTKSCHDGWGKDGYHKIIEPPKTGHSVRVIPLPKQLVGVLKKARKEVGGDKAISIRSYQRTFELVQKKLHIPRRGFHALRHTFATRAIECSMDVNTLSEILGHKNSTITLNRYIHSLMAHKHMMMSRLGKLSHKDGGISPPTLYM